MKRGKGGFCMFLLVLAAFLILNCASIVYGYEKEVYLENQANIHSDGTCGRSEHGWMDDCNTNVFSGSGPGGCRSSGVSGGIGGCYFWQPTKNPKVVAESQTKLPQNNWNPGKLTVWTAHYGGGTYQNEEVNVYVNGKKVGRTDDNWCNLGHDCFSEEECDECRSDGPYQKLFTNVTFKKGWNRIRFEAVNNGGSVYVYKYKIEASPVTTGCIPGQNETQACGNCGTQSRTCLANGTWGNWGTCTGQGVCSPGSLEGQACGTGLPGICSAGTQSRTCNGVCQWGNFGSCQQTNNATTEICNLLDDDCDSAVDETCFTCISNTIPYNMTTGQTQSVSVTVRNDGSVPWTRNDFYRLGSQNPQDNLVWGLGRAYIAPSVVVNQSQQYTFNFNITAPTSTGIYHNEWRMVKDFAFWLLPPNCGHDVNVGNVTQDCIPGQVETQACGNCGTQSRTCLANGTWGVWGTCTGQGVCSPGSLEGQACGTGLPGICSAGTQSRTCNGVCQWGNFSSCQQTNNATTEICNLLDDDCDGQTDEVCFTCMSNTIPYSMTTGQTQSVSVTVRNDGSVPWTRNDFYRLGSQNPQDNLVWGLGRAYIAPSVVVNQSQQYTFNFNITAPSSTGIYHNEWRMVKDFAFWFLPPNCGHDVNVVNETQECIPVQNENQTCGVTDIGLCELGLQSRTCTDNGTWTDWGECIGVVLPSTEICNLLDDDCDGYIDEGNVCNVCNLDGISIRGTGGDINYIDEYNNITNEDVEFSAWLRKDSLGNYSGILSLTARGEVNGEDIQIRAKGKVREVWENDCSVLNVDNSYWSLATYKEPGKAPIQVTYDSIVYNWDKENGLLDIYGLGPDLDFNITGIMVTE